MLADVVEGGIFYKVLLADYWPRTSICRERRLLVTLWGHLSNPLSKLSAGRPSIKNVLSREPGARLISHDDNEQRQVISRRDITRGPKPKFGQK